MVNVSDHISDQIFDIARSAGFSVEGLVEQPVEDVAFSEFQRHYADWSKARDANLNRHLERTPKLFRVLLPFHANVLQTVLQVGWYFDEVVMRDPIEAALEGNSTDVEQQKYDVGQAVRALGGVRDLIAGGYLLLKGRGVVGTHSIGEVSVPEQLLNDAELRRELRSAIECGSRPARDSLGNDTNVIRVKLGGAMIVQCQMTIGPGATVQSPDLNPFREFRTVDPNPILEGLDRREVDGLRHLYETEIATTLKVAEVARRIGAAVLFDQAHRGEIVSRCPVVADRNRQLATIGSLNVALPYLNGISGTDLLELRAALPSEFDDLRRRLHGLVSRVADASDSDGARIIEDEIRGSIGGLDADLRAAARKLRIRSVGGLAATGMGTLVGGVLGGPASAIALGAIGGVTAAVHSYADAVETRTKAVARPYYFLWRATSGRRS